MNWYHLETLLLLIHFEKHHVDDIDIVKILFVVKNKGMEFVCFKQTEYDAMEQTEYDGMEPVCFKETEYIKHKEIEWIIKYWS